MMPPEVVEEPEPPSPSSRSSWTGALSDARVVNIHGSTLISVAGDLHYYNFCHRQSEVRFTRSLASSSSLYRTQRSSGQPVPAGDVTGDGIRPKFSPRTNGRTVSESSSGSRHGDLVSEDGVFLENHEASNPDRFLCESCGSASGMNGAPTFGPVNLHPSQQSRESVYSHHFYLSNAIISTMSSTSLHHPQSFSPSDPSLGQPERRPEPTRVHDSNEGLSEGTTSEASDSSKVIQPSIGHCRSEPNTLSLQRGAPDPECEAVGAPLVPKASTFQQTSQRPLHPVSPLPNIVDIDHICLKLPNVDDVKEFSEDVREITDILSRLLLREPRWKDGLSSEHRMLLEKCVIQFRHYCKHAHALLQMFMNCSRDFPTVFESVMDPNLYPDLKPFVDEMRARIEAISAGIRAAERYYTDFTLQFRQLTRGAPRDYHRRLKNLDKDQLVLERLDTFWKVLSTQLSKILDHGSRPPLPFIVAHGGTQWQAYTDSLLDAIRVLTQSSDALKASLNTQESKGLGLLELGTMYMMKVLRRFWLGRGKVKVHIISWQLP